MLKVNSMHVDVYMQVLWRVIISMLMSNSSVNYDLSLQIGGLKMFLAYRLHCSSNFLSVLHAESLILLQCLYLTEG